MATFTAPPPQYLPVAPGPALSAKLIPGGGTTYTQPTRAIYFGASGSLVATLVGDTVAVTFVAVAAGTTLEISTMNITSAPATCIALF